MKAIFGAMNIGEPGDGRTRVHTLPQARKMIQVFHSHGHTTIDTARLYGFGTSEEFLSQLNLPALSCTIDTKLFPTAVNPALASSSPESIYHHTPADLRRGLMESLKALNVKKINTWYLHSPDRTVPFEETLREVNTLYQEGYFDRLGLSNYQSWEIASICEICDRNGWIKPSVCQGIYNAFHRAVEPELLKCLRYHGISFYCFNPLAAGMLTSRYSRDKPDTVTGGRFDPATQAGTFTRKRYYQEVYFDALEVLRPVAGKYGISEVECALRWLVHHSELRAELGDGIVIGSSSEGQMEENLVAMEGGPLPGEVVEALDRGYEIVRGNQLIYWH
ncbi:aldo/keto reductase family protein [Aspergillus ibericus CBS 121593]|uniref:Aldo/keto reductase n=1 Tax=Aspergillus ibericus CBS 121593 TaxID=1448316 RepID=A0A395H9Y9_9EURO|nr:Aldo/keto reductase [Aspergillus ibericus CBS 121593]RAL03718.1 Aldo/keto reductase [Aspergillus ibericus CBS 121593]